MVFVSIDLGSIRRDDWRCIILYLMNSLGVEGTLQLISLIDQQHMELLTKTNPANKYTQDCNYLFLQQISQHKKQMWNLNTTQLENKIQAIANLLKSLTRDQRIEWTQTYQNNCRQIAKKIVSSSDPDRSEIPLEGNGQSKQSLESSNKALSKVFKQHARILVYACYSLEIDYSKDEIQKHIKDVYFKEYREEIIPNFLSAGYATDQYEILRYEENKWKKWLCCCSEIDE